MKKVLTIAGSDSGGCAGIQADIKAISACGGFAMSAIAAITCQNTVEVRSFIEVPLEYVAEQIDAVMSDIGADSVKTGMLPSKEVIFLVSDMLSKYHVSRYVLDPVMVAASGAKLVQDDALDAIREKLVRKALIVTPNLFEAELIAGVKIQTQADVDKACAIIYSMGARNVLIKGGHFAGENAIDTLYDGKNYHEFSAKRVETKNIHGTGCTYASAIATFIAKGLSVEESVGKAKQYITNAIIAGVDLEIGKGHGPVHHFYNFKLD